MNLGEMRAWVLRTIQRPEKLEDAIDAINSALELIAARGDFAIDLVEGQYALNGALAAQSISISANFPRFRKIKYLRPDGYFVYLKWKDPSRIFQEKAPGVGQELLDVWYRAGDQILLKLSVLQSVLHYGYYAYPTVLVDPADTHWMLTQMGTTVHAFASSLLFEDIGNEAEATRLERRGEKFLIAHKFDKQDGVSHS